MEKYVLDDLSIKALKLLYDKPEGLRFDELSIEEATCAFLIKNNYIYMPPGSMIDTSSGVKRKYDGPITITSFGRAYIEFLRRENKRIHISTLIPLVALIKSFDEEIHAILAWLWKLLMQ